MNYTALYILPVYLYTYIIYRAQARTLKQSAVGDCVCRCATMLRLSTK